MRGRGYRVDGQFELLCEDLILSELSAHNRHTLRALELLFEIDSTNEHLLTRALAGVDLPRACLAEVQSAGRGRMGRRFVSPLGGNLYLSLSTHTDNAPAALLGMSPAIAVAVADALSEIGVRDIGLKWPNDLYVGDRKLSGILLELGQDPAGRSVLVVGIGVNVRLSSAARAAVGQPITDLHAALGRMPERNRVAGRILDRVMAALRTYVARGFEGFRSAFDARDVLRGRDVIVDCANGDLRGRAIGLDSRGVLLLEVDGRSTPILSGDVRVRPTE